MATFISMPKLGLSMESGVVTKWLKHEGDEVEKGEALFELETDKLSNTVEAPADGILRKILVTEGTEVPILTKVGILAAAGEDISSLSEENEQANTSVSMENPKVMSEENRPPKAVDGWIVATPRARAVAKELGIDLAQVSPSGPNGRIVERDVQSYHQQAQRTKVSSLAARAANDLQIDLGRICKDGRVMMEDLLTYVNGAISTEEEKPMREERRPMNGMRRAIAQNMLASHMASPTVTYDISVDMSAMKRCKTQLAAGGLKVSYRNDHCHGTAENRL